MGERIAAVRAELGLSRQAIAERARKHGATKIVETTIQKLEERSSTKSQYSREIALALGVSHDWLTSEKGPKHPPKSLDQKLRLLPQEDFDDVYDDLAAIIDRRLEKRGIRS